jgi:hypothetical protein
VTHSFLQEENANLQHVARAKIELRKRSVRRVELVIPLHVLGADAERREQVLLRKRRKRSARSALDHSAGDFYVARAIASARSGIVEHRQIEYEFDPVL